MLNLQEGTNDADVPRGVFNFSLRNNCQSCAIFFLPEPGDNVVPISAETDSVFTIICCLSWLVREPKHAICITVKQMVFLQDVS